MTTDKELPRSTVLIPVFAPAVVVISLLVIGTISNPELAGHAFSATLAYHRMAADNELTASHAGGISHRMVLLPAAVTGIILAAAVLVLSNQVIPRFLRAMEELVTADATRIFTSTIKSGYPVSLDEITLYADDIDTLDPIPEHGIDQQLFMQGVLVVRRDTDGNVQGEISSQQARVYLRRISDDMMTPGLDERDASTQVTIQLNNAVGQGMGEPLRGTTNQAVITKTIPNAFSDDPKFLTNTELLALRETPENMNWIERRRRQLATALAQRATIDDIRAALAQHNQVHFKDPLGRTVILSAQGLAWDHERVAQRITPKGRPTDPIVIERYYNESYQKQLAQRAWLAAPTDPNNPNNSVTVSLILEEVTTRTHNTEGQADLGDVTVEHRTATQLVPIYERPEQSRPRRIMMFDTDALIQYADEIIENRPNDAFIIGPRDELVRKIDKLNREITSKIHERFAMAAAAFVMVITGAVLAMKLREAQPLVVYLWSFFPALAAILTISVGQQNVHRHGSSWLILLWGGVAALILYTLSQLRTVARH